MKTLLPKGTFLFHGTGEPNSIQTSADFRKSGDGMFWCARDSAIAQTYIPTAGSTVYFRLETLLSPNLNGELCPLHQFQLDNGLEFRDVSWEGTQLKSYGIAREPFPYEWADDFETRWERSQEAKKKTLQHFADKLNSLGYQKDEFSQDLSYSHWSVKTQSIRIPGSEKSQRKIMPRDWLLPGFLFILETTRDLEFFDIASGNEGDLTDPDHLKYSIFKKTEEGGRHSGILINDFAQVTEDHSNFGHQSYGLCGDFADKIRILDRIPATHPREFWETHYKPHDYRSLEYRTWLSTQGIQQACA